jgi:hypothetical protein
MLETTRTDGDILVLIVEHQRAPGMREALEAEAPGNPRAAKLLALWHAVHEGDEQAANA